MDFDKLQAIAIRAGKTFAQGVISFVLVSGAAYFSGVNVADGDAVRTAAFGLAFAAIAAGASAVWNMLGTLPEVQAWKRDAELIDGVVTAAADTKGEDD